MIELRIVYDEDTNELKEISGLPQYPNGQLAKTPTIGVLQLAIMSIANLKSKPGGIMLANHLPPLPNGRPQ